MTVKELVDRVETNLRLMGISPVPGDADILMYLNEENQRMSRDLRVPTRYVTEIDATQPFILPSEAQPGSLKFAEKADYNWRVEVLTVSEANELYPDWEKNEHEGGIRYGHRLIIYDPANISAPVYPLGFSAGAELQMTYTVRPKPLVLDNPDADVSVSLAPFEGVIPEYHSLLAKLATYQMAMLMGDPEKGHIQKARTLYSEAMLEAQDAFSYARPDVQLPGVRWAGRY